MRVVKHWVDGVLVEHTVNDIPRLNKSKKDWPLLIRPMKLLAKPDDKGLGDIVERTIGPVGGDAYKLWYKATFGKTCGCTKRKDNLNERYPL